MVLILRVSVLPNFYALMLHISKNEQFRLPDMMFQASPAFEWVVGWCDGAGQSSSVGASYNLDYSRARVYCA